MKKKMGVISLLIICLTFVSYIYLKKEPVVEEESVCLKTVVFQDLDKELIPVSVNFNSEVELEQEVRNRIELMKSKDFTTYGLYPVLDSKLEVLSVQEENGTMILNVNDQFNLKKQDMSVLEALTFMLNDYEDIQVLKLQVNGQDISTLPHTQLPVSALTKELGLNNFIETSNILHETIPVMVYNQKQIQNYSYYVPTTIRIDERDTIDDQVRTILSFIEGKIHVLNAYLEDGVLNVELDSNILLDNEDIDKTLQELMILSLSNLPEVKDIHIQVNHEEIETQKSSTIEYNYIKI